jgi:hypothetical protein
MKKTMADGEAEEDHTQEKDEGGDRRGMAVQEMLQPAERPFPLLLLDRNARRLGGSAGLIGQHGGGHPDPPMAAARKGGIGPPFRLSSASRF